MALGKKTKKKLLIAGGAAGAIAIGALIFWPRKASAAETPAPPASDSDVQKVADYALAHETSSAVLRQLATAMLIFPYSNPLRNKVGALQARATELELAHQVVQDGGGSTAHVGNF